MITQAQPRSILIVEDNEDNLVIYGTLLQAYGFIVHEVAAGEAALDAADLIRPHIILMDIGLPGMDGVAVTRMLKTNRSTAHMPVLALTAHALLAERERAMEAGVDAYLFKPITGEMLVRAVERAVERALPRTPVPLAIVRPDSDPDADD